MLGHHQSTLYAQLDDTWATQLSFVESTNSYNIEMRLERLSNIESSQIIYESTIEPIYFEPHLDQQDTSDTEPYELVKRFTHQWATALSSITKVFGPASSASGISTFAINLPEQINPSVGTALERVERPLSDSEATPETTLPTFDDIGGAYYAKEQLRPIMYAFTYPEIATHYDIQPSSFILHGPGGTGKTSLVHAFANSVNAEIHEYASSDIVSKWVGQSGEKMAEIFTKAKETEGPLVLFFDEFDSIAPKGDAGTSERRDVKNILKRELSIIAKHHPNIIVAAATNNDTDDFDEPLLRAGRLQPIPVLAPTATERAEIWSLMLERSIYKTSPSIPVTDTEFDAIVSKKPVYAIADLNLAELTEATDDYTGADIEQILIAARQKAFVTAVETGEMQSITHADLMAAIRHYQKP
jgi:SpoVK/Ycf46/Vps4 family AAA+-type ATPase